MGRQDNSINIFNKYASGYNEKYLDVSFYKNYLDLFCEKLQGKKVLDLGCGPGNIAKYILDKTPQIELLGVDLAPRMIEIARENNPRANFRVMDCLSLNEIDEKYDGIIAGFCFPYLSKKNALKLISYISKRLNPGGLFYLSTIEDNYEKSGYKYSANSEDGLYTYYHQSDYLISEIKASGLDIILEERLQNPEEEEGRMDLILIAKKEL